MSDSSDSDSATHRVVRKRYRRTRTSKTFEQGDAITPTEGELAAFGDRFAPIEEEPATTQQATQQAAQQTGGSAEDTSPTEHTESASDEASPLPEGVATPHDLTGEQLATIPYNKLRKLAAKTKKVSGNSPADEMRRGIAKAYGIDYPPSKKKQKGGDSE